jgi:hypothetical protein
MADGEDEDPAAVFSAPDMSEDQLPDDDFTAAANATEEVTLDDAPQDETSKDVETIPAPVSTADRTPASSAGGGGASTTNRQAASAMSPPPPGGKDALPSHHDTLPNQSAGSSTLRPPRVEKRQPPKPGFDAHRKKALHDNRSGEKRPPPSGPPDGETHIGTDSKLPVDKTRLGPDFKQIEHLLNKDTFYLGFPNYPLPKVLLNTRLVTADIDPSDPETGNIPDQGQHLANRWTDSSPWWLDSGHLRILNHPSGISRMPWPRRIPCGPQSKLR